MMPLGLMQKEEYKEAKRLPLIEETLKGESENQSFIEPIPNNHNPLVIDNNEKFQGTICADEREV